MTGTVQRLSRVPVVTPCYGTPKRHFARKHDYPGKVSSSGFPVTFYMERSPTLGAFSIRAKFPENLLTLILSSLCGTIKLWALAISKLSLTVWLVVNERTLYEIKYKLAFFLERLNKVMNKNTSHSMLLSIAKSTVFTNVHRCQRE